MIGVRIVDFRSVRRNSLLGFARVELPSGMVIADVTVMLAGTTGRPWASPPSKPMVDREGVVLKDPNGKIRYTPIIEFTSREIRTRWSDAVIAAMQAAHPEAFVPRAAASVAIRLSGMSVAQGRPVAGLRRPPAAAPGRIAGRPERGQLALGALLATL
jgi:hypothetical protein